MPIRRIAVLITSHNRRELTLGSLSALFRQRGLEEIELSVYLVDDGSTDGTAEAVQSSYPKVHILAGSGDLFWCGGMRLAFATAMQDDPDAYLLMNDDTILYEDALLRTVKCAFDLIAARKPSIVVGSTCAPGSTKRTYGGFVVHKRGLSFEFHPVLPHQTEAIVCDTLNGNFALIPREIARAVGNIDPRFRHQLGDLDYGLRARQLGFSIVVAPGYIGECGQNARAGTWRDPSASFAKRWKNLMSPKGVPVREWVIFTRRHYGWRWLHYAASPYAKTIGLSLSWRTVNHPRAG